MMKIWDYEWKKGKLSIYTDKDNMYRIVLEEDGKEREVDDRWINEHQALHWALNYVCRRSLEE